MPQIKEYQQRERAEGGNVSVGIPQRRASEEDFSGAGAGGDALAQGLLRSGQNFFAVSRALHAREAEAEVTDVYTRTAEFQANWTLNLNERVLKATPGDATFATNFLDEVKHGLEGLDGSYTTPEGQQTFRRRAAELGAHFATAAGSAQAKLAAAKAVQDYTKLVDADANLLRNDPSQFDAVLKTALTALQDPNSVYSRMPVEKRLELEHATKSDLAFATIKGKILLDPVSTEKELLAGNWDEYLTDTKKDVLMKTAATAKHGLEVEEYRKERNRIHARNEAARAASENIVKLLAEGKLTVDAIMKEENLNPTGEGSREHYINLLHTRSREQVQLVHSDPAVMHDLFTRIHAPYGDSRKITNTTELDKAYIAQKIDFNDFLKLRREFIDARSPEGERLGAQRTEFEKAMKPQFSKANPLLGKLDPDGDKAVYEFNFFVGKKIEQYREAGKDPFDLFDPAKPEYLGKPETLTRFKKTLMQSIHDVSDRLRVQPGAPKAPDGGVADETRRRNNETIEQWKARIGK